MDFGFHIRKKLTAKAGAQIKAHETIVFLLYSIF